jgi:NAD(P)-dependent dehydrogenase (short-subunit alcohol dehydrogenase family)
MPGAIVTGAGSGIGRATALALAAAGHDVGITTRANVAGAERTCELVRAAGRTSTWRRLDLADADSAGRVIDALMDDLGDPTVLVNNAGANSRTPAVEDELAAFRRVLEINLTGAFACSQAFARRVMSARTAGVIVNVTSVLAHAPLAGAASYCASKAGLDALTKALAIEWAPFSIRVNAVAPGHTVTPMNFDEEVDPGAVDRPQIPLGRPAAVEEIAAAIAFLAGPSAAYATGSSLTVDGGLLLVSGPGVLEAAHPNAQSR